MNDEQIAQAQEKIEQYEKQEQERKFKAEFMNVAYEQGKIKGIENLLIGLREKYDFLRKPNEIPETIGGMALNPDGSNEQIKGQITERQLQEAAEKARKSGKIEDRVAYAMLRKKLGGQQ